MSNGKTISADDFDRRFDAGEDVSAFIDRSSAQRPGLAVRRVNVDMPAAMIARLDLQAKRRGVTRQALIKMWLADRLDSAA
jgi:CopG antitoxin of type II toxin-antitoxin system